jgi:hypothetical protein
VKETLCFEGATEPGMDNTKAFRMAFASVYPHYIAKAERKCRTREEVHAIIHWLTGYDEQALQRQIDKKVDFETFFAQAPRINPNVSKIKGVICGYRVEDIEDKLMQQIRYLDKLVDELAKGKAIDKILRK